MISHILIENNESISVQRLSCDRYNILVAVAEISRKKKIEPKSADTRYLTINAMFYALVVE